MPVNKSKQGGTIGGASISPMGGEITGDRRHERERKTERRGREREREREREIEYCLYWINIRNRKEWKNKRNVN